MTLTSFFGGLKINVQLTIKPCLRGFSYFLQIPDRVKATYFDLRDKKKYSDVSLFAGMLLTPVVFCLLCIALLDMLYSRRPIPGVMHHHHD